MGLATIQAATDNFSVENKLGEGGFGAVYKALNWFFLSLFLNRFMATQIKIGRIILRAGSPGRRERNSSQKAITGIQTKPF